ncbi:poly(ADP-ribose) glycohydrolase-like isoform X2 [Cloeon dipterum]|uniref:poly(ADP-ribose) glycohydrolase-like isoform X2 n=1 Tax=Cloeon dipterum TaxID=197152 RepID=UPI0032200ED3
MDSGAEPERKKVKLMEKDAPANGYHEGTTDEDDEMHIDEPSSPDRADHENPVAGSSDQWEGGNFHALSPEGSSVASREEHDEDVMEDTPQTQSKPVCPGRSTLEDLKWKTSTTSLPPVEPSPDHFVFYKLPWENKAPEPRSAPFDLHQSSIKLPCCNSSVWQRVEEALRSRINNGRQLIEIIQKCSGRNLDCNLLLELLHGRREASFIEEETENLFAVVIPKIQQLALKLPELVKQPIPILNPGQSISLSQLQVASLLANAFFCTFASRKRNVNHMPDINFQGLYYLPRGDQSHVESNMEKLKCLFSYFRKVDLESGEPSGVVTFHRREVQNSPQWNESTKPIKRLHISRKGTIEDDGTYMLQMDFANKYLGGGVLGQGCVQEEIRFAICPELIAGCLFNKVMLEKEAIIICGAQQFCKYDGYGSSFQWESNFNDVTPRDASGRLCVSVVALDAIPFYGRKSRQYEVSNMDRELNKAYAGFMVDEGAESIPVATGNWGCGVFGGDPKLKSVLQLLAASECGRDLVYFTFRDKSLIEPLYELHSLLLQTEATVGEVYRNLMEYKPSNENVLSYLKRKIQKNVPITKYIKSCARLDESADKNMKSEAQCEERVSEQADAQLKHKDEPACAAKDAIKELQGTTLAGESTSAEAKTKEDDSNTAVSKVKYQTTLDKFFKKSQ